ncbi:NAD(P)/FAD-dependent oxidoreductase [Geobacillus thermodenitrificans]|uniref:NAD(P)/FAD-dependent oxidoreductase n=1 Tax=Geobacillus thermodenitrificans TaxID=33940 RepID=UPI002E201ADA|nr:FAD-dependent oxidoreductase [Geobacillus thermodenitrificans]MED3907078.1 FAD-dependent oxidoreductase [Geobacillus thermodenitrificans]
METEVLVIGAGPAGLAAAFETASRGLDVTIVDESTVKGGQLCQQTQIIRALPSIFQPMRGFELAKLLTNQLEDFSVRYLLKHRLIGLYRDGSVGITNEVDVFPIKFKKLVIATGAAENAILFPKWTLPGIITIGAAQTLINRDFVIPGKNSVIVGSSDFAMDVALQLLDVGVNVKAIIEAQSDVLARDKEKVKRVKKSGISFYLNSSIVEARGKDEVSEIDIQLPNKRITEKVDLVCVDGGRSPILDAFYQLGCSFGYQGELGGWIPQYNEFFQTDREDVFLAGNAAGVSSQGAVIVTGMIAGVSVCESLRIIDNREAEKIRISLWRELENIESSLYPDVWQARINHIKSFKYPLLKNQFIL